MHKCVYVSLTILRYTFNLQLNSDFWNHFHSHDIIILDICFWPIHGTMQTFVPIHQEIRILHIMIYFQILCHNSGISPEIENVRPIELGITVYILRSWTATVENTLPMHHYICSLQIYSNFLWFLNRISLSPPPKKRNQNSKLCYKHTSFITYIVSKVIYYQCAKCKTKYINNYGN